MREPRPTQRFPRHGKDLYEALRRDAEPTLIWVVPEEDQTGSTVLQDYTLLWSRFFDPMLFFWPVEYQHVVALFWIEVDDKLVKRLVKALLRDGADWVTVSRPNNTRVRSYKDAVTARTRHWEQYGDAQQFITRRYGTVDTMGLPGAHSESGRERSQPARTDLLADRIREDDDGDGAHLQSVQAR